MKKVIIHYHIFKNAGSTLDRWLSETFAGRWMQFESGVADRLLGHRDVAEFLQNNSDAVAISSHTLRPPTPFGFDVFPIVCIRHPLDRAYSAYAHEARCVPNTRSCEVARATNFAGYVEWCLDHPEKGGVVILNYQVIHLSRASFRHGHVYLAQPTAGDLEEAERFLAGLPFVGVVDRLDAQWAELRRSIEIWGGWRVDGPAPRTNVTPGRPSSMAERLELARYELGEALLNRFLKANALDFELYASAVRLDGERMTGRRSNATNHMQAVERHAPEIRGVNERRSRKPPHLS